MPFGTHKPLLVAETDEYKWSFLLITKLAMALRSACLSGRHIPTSEWQMTSPSLVTSSGASLPSRQTPRGFSQPSPASGSEKKKKKCRRRPKQGQKILEAWERECWANYANTQVVPMPPPPQPVPQQPVSWEQQPVSWQQQPVLWQQQQQQPLPPPQMPLPQPQMQFPQPQMQFPQPQMQLPPLQMQLPPSQMQLPPPAPRSEKKKKKKKCRRRPKRGQKILKAWERECWANYATTQVVPMPPPPQPVPQQPVPQQPVSWRQQQPVSWRQQQPVLWQQQQQQPLPPPQMPLPQPQMLLPPPQMALSPLQMVLSLRQMRLPPSQMRLPPSQMQLPAPQMQLPAPQSQLALGEISLAMPEMTALLQEAQGTARGGKKQKMNQQWPQHSIYAFPDSSVPNSSVPGYPLAITSHPDCPLPDVTMLNLLMKTSPPALKESALEVEVTPSGSGAVLEEGATLLRPELDLAQKPRVIEEEGSSIDESQRVQCAPELPSPLSVNGQASTGKTIAVEIEALVTAVPNAAGQETLEEEAMRLLAHVKKEFCAGELDASEDCGTCETALPLSNDQAPVTETVTPSFDSSNGFPVLPEDVDKSVVKNRTIKDEPMEATELPNVPFSSDDHLAHGSSSAGDPFRGQKRSAGVCDGKSTPTSSSCGLSPSCPGKRKKVTKH